ncbi:aerobic respiration control sensor protein arcB [Aulographum hederae CBS 113979]|uniref:histidine kinase n=1 Tax=Aulographum hederae CBS 113979 TaxID=1176131 RepID=A0A6G1H6Y7_9PEZI|nr:aerobic respiration control sensor protein arcB [Aulographum hederae CBS 113979]
MDEFNAIGIDEILDQNSRPTFVIDLDPDDERPNHTDGLLPIFCNSALRLHERLFDAVVTKTDGLPTEQERSYYQDFKTWATGVTKFDDSKDVFPLSYMYSDMLWTGSTVRKRWRLISGSLLWGANIPLRNLSSGPPSEISTGGIRVEQSSEKYNADVVATRKRSFAQTESSLPTAKSTTLVASEQPRTSKPFYLTQKGPSAGGSSDDTGSSSQSKTSITLTKPERAVVDWTVKKPKGVLTAHVQFARGVKWSATPLGGMDTWSPEFRQAANLLMGNPHPAALFWGSELTMLYNEAYVNEVAGNKHPGLMGTGFSGPFSELWDGVAPIFAECARTGVSVRRDNDYLPIHRRGLLEETFFSWSFTPVYGGTDRILGFYNAPFETTQQVLSHRRMQTINRLGEYVSRAKTIKQFWKLLLEGLEDNHFDVPFALLYSVGDSDDMDHSSMSSGSTISLKSCYFEGSIGIPDGHIAAPHQLDLKRSREGFIPSFREAMRTREPTTLHTRDGTLPEELLEGINWRGFGDPCQEAIIFPVRPTNGDNVLAFLLLGVNPRRPYDLEYQAFTNLLNRQMATSLASVMLFEEEVRKNRDAAEVAALEQKHLTEQLAVQTDRMRRMTELSPLGMFLISPEGLLREANERWWEMTGHPRHDLFEMSWMECIFESSRETMNKGWHRMVHDRLPWSGELQLKPVSGSPVNLQGEEIDYWVLSSAQPEFASDGSLRSVMGSICDISHSKWAQSLQSRRLKEAEETRRQQNEFIDITSHEMRNPMSAILQCADDISSALEAHQSNGTAPTPTTVENCVDAANTIGLCVKHQKTIVDDILTISKLDSNLLVLTPIPVQPLAVVQRAVKMFDPELQAKDIQVVFDLTPSLQELKIDWVTLDPVRVLQILINFMTNAIKFTAGAPKRVITVIVAASIEQPQHVQIPGFEYIPTRNANPNATSNESWGKGSEVYLRFKVQDTGCGLTAEEKQVLFGRFSQASPRTHAQYGGSGLGLFISRQLAELHGGQIGVASEFGVGSTFGFFIATRRSGPPGRSIPQDGLTTSQDLRGDASFGQDITIHNEPAEPRPEAASAATADDGAPKIDPKDLHILVVEDNLVNQKVLVRLLKNIGITVAVANDGLEALAFLETTHYRISGSAGKPLSVILMDLEMPNMDGLTCVREIRAMEKRGEVVGGRHVPVIAVTANVRDEQVRAAREAGMDEVVSKPFRIPELLGKIDVLLGGGGAGGNGGGEGESAAGAGAER